MRSESKIRASVWIAIIAAIPLAFLALFFAWPVGAMLWRGLSSGVAGAGAELASSPRTLRIIWQTVWMALAGTAASVALGVPGAYVLYRLRLPAAALWRGIVTVPFVLPTVVVGIAFRALFEGPLAFLGLQQSTAAVVMAMVFFNYSVVVRTVGSMWAGLDSRQTEAARTLGASPWQAFRTVTLPQLMPAIAAAAALVFLFCSTAYGIVTALGRPAQGTIETEIYVQTVTYFNLDKAALLSLVQFVLVAAALLASTRLTARTETALKSSTRPPARPRRSDAPAIAVTALVIAYLIAPMLTLVLRSLRSGGAWSLANYQLLAAQGLDFAGGITVAQALRHSLAIAADATLISLAVGIPLAYVLSRRVQPGSGAALAQRLMDGFVLLPLGVSTVTMGFGFLLTFASTPLARSPWLVPLAQGIVALPLVVRAIVPAARAIEPRMREAAATLGASPLRVALTIDLPLALRGIGLAVGFAFATSLGEFGATSFLARADYLTLPVLIIKLLGRPGAHNYGMALAGAVILAAATALVMMAAEIVAARRKERCDA